MPHNLFLHSEIIQSRQWNLEDDSVIKQQLKYEFKDTLFSMIIGWAINSAMILMAAATLYQGGNGRQIDDLTVAGKMLSPLMGNAARSGNCHTPIPCYRKLALLDLHSHYFPGNELPLCSCT